MKNLIVEVSGRFGNHLHQIMAGKSIAIDHGMNFYINSSNNHWAFEKYVETDIPMLNINDIQYERIGIFAPDHIVLDFPRKNTLLSSYFLNYKWHLHNRDVLIDWMKFKTANVQEAARIRGTFTKPTCAIHVRRDDYLALDYYPIVKEEYYLKAIQELGDIQYVVCSDDIAWCEQFFGKLPGSFYFSKNEFLTDFLLMSMCDNAVIANSSFSYWAAYFNKNCHRVFYPCVWSLYFANGGRDIDELCPPNWTKIDYAS